MFWIVRFPSFLLPHHLQPFIIRSLLFTPEPHPLSRPPICCLHPQPTSLHRSSLRPAPRACICRRLTFRIAPPFAALGLHLGPCCPLGGLLAAGPSASQWYFLFLPEVSSEYFHRPVLVSVSGGFSQKVERPSCLHSLAVMRPSLFSPRYLAIPAPFRLTTLSLSHLPTPPLFAVIPSLSVEELWGVALEVSVLCDGSSHGRGCLTCKTEGRGKWYAFSTVIIRTIIILHCHFKTYRFIIGTNAPKNKHGCI